MISIPLPKGGALRFADRNENPYGTDFVSLAMPDGAEYYWCSDEWAEDPEGVMGAIVGLLCDRFDNVEQTRDCDGFCDHNHDHTNSCEAK